MVIFPGFGGGRKPTDTSVADSGSSPFVFVVRCDIPDRFVQSDPVVLAAHAFELDGEDGGVGDGVQVRPFALHVAP